MWSVSAAEEKIISILEYRKNHALSTQAPQQLAIADNQ
jgi:hypothetical protein|tara:strand:+ start:161 stop:274 length:114 start_codon:yes stop_codon:yes gene_type:complete